MANCVLVIETTRKTSNDGAYIYAPLDATGTSQANNIALDWSYGSDSGTITSTQVIKISYSSSVTISNTVQSSITVDGVIYDFLCFAVLGYNSQEGVKDSYYDGSNPYSVTVPTSVSYDYYTTHIYKRRTVTVTLDKQNGTGGTSSVSVYYGATMPTIETPTRNGYDFQGYYTSPNGQGIKYYNADGTGARIWGSNNNTTLYAYWTITVYTVTYDANGGAVSPTSETVNANTSVTLPAPTLADATFLGWYSGTTKVGDAGDSYTVTATITLTAQWNRIRSSGFFIFTASATSTPTSMNIGEWRIERSDIDGEDTLYWTITTPFVQAENDRTWNFVSFPFRAVDYYGAGTEFTVRQPSGSWTTAGTGYRYIHSPLSGAVYCRGIYGDYLIYNRNTGFLICNSSGSLAYGNQIISV